MSHNKKLNTLLKSLRNTQVSPSRLDTTKTVAQLRGLGGPIRYDDNGKLGFGLLLLFAGGYGHLLGSERGYPIGLDGTSDFVILIYNALIAIAAGFILFWFFRRRKARKFVQKVFEHAALDSYGFSDEQAPTLKELDRHFHEFNRGNDSRKIVYFMSAPGDGDKIRQGYSLFQFHWVVREERQVTDTDHNGHSTTKTETTYHHYDRYGVMLEGSYSGIQITSDAPDGRYKRKYRPASVEFNRRYKIRCVEEMQAAKLLKPSVVIALDNAGAQLKSPNLEYGLNGHMCLTWANDPLNVRTVMRSKDSADELANIIEAGAKLPVLEEALQLISDIQRHTQSNFSNLGGNNASTSIQGVK
jgi:hypothetical protein